jgi:hypothetical protein
MNRTVRDDQLTACDLQEEQRVDFPTSRHGPFKSQSLVDGNSPSEAYFNQIVFRKRPKIKCVPMAIGLN